MCLLRIGAAITVFTAIVRYGNAWINPKYPIESVVSQWREENPDQLLPAPPKEGIQVGLPNFTFNCWFNASLKFMAATTYFDSMLEPKSNEKDQLRHYLAALFIYLRCNNEKHTLNKACFKEYFDRIVSTVTEKTKFSYEDEEQCDPSEFLRGLTQYLDFKTDYISEFWSNIKGDELDEYSSCFVSIDVSEEMKWYPKTHIDLEEAIISKTEIEGKKIKKCFPIELPEQLLLEIRRFGYQTKEIELPYTIREDEKGKEFIPTETKVVLQKFGNEIDIKEGCVSLPIYDKEMNLVDTITYRVVGSIIHVGSSIDYGHFVSTEVSKNGHQLHNDHEITTIEDWRERDSYLLHLIKTTEILTDD